MYRHSITVYDKDGNLLASISDKVNLQEHGYAAYTGASYLGGPVEAAFCNEGKTLWVSNYNMIGPGFDNPGCDACNGKTYDPGFVYKINTTNFQIENVVQVGAVPKYLAISRDEQKLVVSNWSSGDISIVDLGTETEIRKVDVGAHPRGVAISSDSKWAFVTIMGSTKIAKVNLENYAVSYIEHIGKSPRHALLSANDSLLYVSLNSSNSLIKYNLHNDVRQTCQTNAGPRSMILSPDQQYLYVVNYFANTFSKIRTDSMQVVEIVNTGHHPIGITANWEDAELWVACYEGKIEIFKDFQLAEELYRENYLFEQELAEFMRLFQPRFSAGQQAVTGESLMVTESSSSKVDLQPADDETVEITALEVNQTTHVVGLKKPLAVKGGVSKAHTVRDIQAKNLEADPVQKQNCGYHVIVGSFSVYENAVKFKATVADKGYTARLIPSSKGLTYVSADCFESRSEAEGALNQIHADLDVRGWVLHQE